MGKEKINCFKCKHFYVTWEKNHPRGCKAMGFKTKYMPSDLVLRSSGRECLMFKEKEVS